MEQQNNNKDKNPAGASSGNRNRNRHRGGRGHGRGQHRSGEQEKKVAAVQETAPAPKEQKQAQPTVQNGGGEQGGKSRNRHRGGRGRGHSRGEAQTPNTAQEVTEQVSREPVQDFFVSPTIHRAGGDKWLDDTFAPLHEVEVHDPAAEEAARRLLDAEGPLLFREEPVEVKEEAVDTTEVVGIRYKVPGKVYYFAPGELKLKCGTYAIVETARGLEYGEVVIANSHVSSDNIVPPLRPVLRAATEEDARHQEENKKKEQEAFRVCLEKIAAHGLDMKLVGTVYLRQLQAAVLLYLGWTRRFPRAGQGSGGCVPYSHRAASDRYP